MGRNEALKNYIVKTKYNFKLKTLLSTDSEERQVRNTIQGLQTGLSV